MTAFSLTTDCPTVMEAVRNQVEYAGLHCIAHVLHKAMEKGCAVHDFGQALNNLRVLVKEIKNSNILQAQLKKLQEDAKKNPLKLKLDIVTRLGYVHEMISR